MALSLVLWPESVLPEAHGPLLGAPLHALQGEEGSVHPES